tara:strand:+ start:389 stop:1396 length:1008 start_codon:yes stop_codon:yes gene_type:complete
MLGNVAASNYNPKAADDLFNIIRGGSNEPNNFVPMYWLDFTDTGNLYQAQNGTSQVTTNDQYIRHVKNKVSFPGYSSSFTGGISTSTLPVGSHFISLADNDTTAPQFKTNVHNGLSAAYFDGDAGLYCSGNSPAEGALLENPGCIFCGLSSNTTISPEFISIWIIFKGTGNVSSDETLYSVSLPEAAGTGCGGTQNFYEFKLESSDDDYEFIAGQEGGATTDFATNINATTDVELWTYCGRNPSAGTARIYRDGDTSDGLSGQTASTEMMFNTSLGGLGTSNCQNHSLGCKVDSSKTFSQHWTGHVFEYIAIEGVVNDTIRELIDNYFKGKYNIS